MEEEKFINVFYQGFIGAGVFFDKTGHTDYPGSAYIHRLEISIALPFVGISFLFTWRTLG